MSGGSYSYLFTKDADNEIWSAQEDLERMALRLAGLGYAQDAARETEELLLIMRQALVRVQVRLDRLRQVFRAVEWWDSCDSGEDVVREVLADYRAEPPAGGPHRPHPPIDRPPATGYTHL